MHGTYGPGFEPLVDQFADHLRSGRDTGASLSVYVDGHKRVDVWGGVADPEQETPWVEDTLAVVYSCSKGLLALCLLGLADTSRVDLKAPVSDYWPEFAAFGKESITLEHVLAHRAGLPLLESSLSRSDILSWHPVIAALEGQSPLWEPGSGHAYHALTLGWLIGEVIRRVTGKLPGEYARTELAPQLNLDTWVGLPEAQHDRLAKSLPSVAEWTSDDIKDGLRELLRSDDRVMRAATLNGALRLPLPGVQEGCDYNDPEVLSSAIPAANCTTTARSLAKLYAACVSSVEGSEPLLSAQIVSDALTVRSAGPMVFGVPGPEPRYGLGFMLTSDVRPMLGPSSFGHDGASGALAFADREARVGFAYVPNRMGGLPDTRANDLVDALRSCLST
ncbi:serine hydrolase domain-containing protein [Nocardioides sp. NPDC051685]|uniref:serine hydrolase domain-containing protein n=1 Tax=Nocardioides sp. NPDC051685 TaxID=3364334 RepID=UPI0037AA5472